MSKVERKTMAFGEVTTYEDLKMSLINRARNLQNTVNGSPKYLCHYTSLAAAVSIIKTKRWYVGSPLNMNDGLELSHADDNDWKKVFYASFMIEPVESIAMWSMYAQPWKDGVMIRLPVEKFKAWLKNDPKISSANANNKQANDDSITSCISLSFHAVAYTNAESKGKNEPEVLMCGQDKNTILKKILTSKELLGFIKDSAWSYENEFRLRADVINNEEFDAVSICIPDDIIDSIEIIAGPRFDGDLLQRVSKEIRDSFKLERTGCSIFKGKLNWIYCDKCKQS